MKKKRVSVVIIGAGPAGSACACALACSGIEPVVLIDRATFPRKKPCAGGLGPGADECLKSIGVWDRVREEANLITGLKAVTVSGREFRTGGLSSALVLPRERFDTILVENAARLGVKVITGERVRSLLWDGEAPSGAVTAGGRRVEAIWTVIAAGGGSKLIGRENGGPFGRVLKTVITRYEGIEVNRRVVELYFDRALKPTYGWVFPEGESAANVGVCYDRSKSRGRKPKDVFYDFTDKYLSDRIKKARRAAPLSGAPIYTSYAPVDIARPGLLVAGEAGWLVNPVTGEGIHQALSCGILAAESIALHLRGKMSAGDAALRYEKKLKLSVCPGLIIGEIFRVFGPTLLELAPLLTATKLRRKKGI